MDILNSLSQALYPGHRVIRVKGFQGAKDYPMPRDSEAIMLDEDPAVSYIYMKKVDVNGGEMCARYRYEEEPVPEFKPEQYITKEEFNSKFEEMLDAINSLKQHRSTADE
jgi:hypothetical protein